LRARTCRGEVARRANRGIRVRRPVREREIREEPALRPVLQRVDGIRDPEVDERLRTDDAAGAAGAVDDDGRGGIGNDLADAIRELAIGAAARARDAHLAEFGERPAVEDHERLARPLHRGEALGGNPRGVACMLDELAEGLARHVHAREEVEARALPSAGPAIEDVDVRVAELLEPPRGARCDAEGAVVARDDARGFPREEPRRLDLQPAERKGDREEEVRLAVLAVLAHVEERDLPPVAEPGLELLRWDRLRHAWIQRSVRTPMSMKRQVPSSRSNATRLSSVSSARPYMCRWRIVWPAGIV